MESKAVVEQDLIIIDDQHLMNVRMNPASLRNRDWLFVTIDTYSGGLTETPGSVSRVKSKADQALY
jgi:hypothetical protein